MNTQAKEFAGRDHWGHRGRGRKYVGALLAVVGAFWFAKKIGWIPVSAITTGIFWPAALIFVGVLLFVGSVHGRRDRNGQDMRP